MQLSVELTCSFIDIIGMDNYDKYAASRGADMQFHLTSVERKLHKYAAFRGAGMEFH